MHDGWGKALPEVSDSLLCKHGDNFRSQERASSLSTQEQPGQAVTSLLLIFILYVVNNDNIIIVIIITFIITIIIMVHNDKMS